nr:hypothetical protein [Rhodococcus opacus]
MAPHPRHPATYPLSIVLGEHVVDLGAVGFRTVHAAHGDGGFRLSVNGVDVYCRGAVWTPVDPVGLGGRNQTRATLERVVEAGLNMVRVPGTAVYEDAAFWDDCAGLGVLVWQDAMLSTFDPPDDQPFLDLLTAEVVAVLRPLSGNPALTVFSGGSETEQQPAMLGLGSPHMTAVHVVIPAVVGRTAPGVVGVSSSPTSPPGGDALATHVGTGIAHYFGDGGYRLPLSDVRQARVRFAAECLAFSIPPSDAAIEAEFGSLAVAGHHPRWKAAVPRDNGASWDFEDVRDHYVRTCSARSRRRSGGATPSGTSPSGGPPSARRSRRLSDTGGGPIRDATARWCSRSATSNPAPGGGCSTPTAGRRPRGS